MATLWLLWEGHPFGPALSCLFSQIPHEWPGVRLYHGKETTFAASDTTSLFLIAAYQARWAPGAAAALTDLRPQLLAAVAYLMSHIDGRCVTSTDGGVGGAGSGSCCTVDFKQSVCRRTIAVLRLGGSAITCCRPRSTVALLVLFARPPFSLIYFTVASTRPSVVPIPLWLLCHDDCRQVPVL